MRQVHTLLKHAEYARLLGLLLEDKMRQVHTLLKRAVATGALLAAAYAVASVSSAQDATTSTTTTTPTTSTAKVKVPPATATPKMIADAVARSKARHDKFLATGTPEQFGSEEPYTPK